MIRAAVVALLAVIMLAGCGRTGPPQHLPKPAQWFGSRVWVPAGYARQLADAVCEGGTENYRTDSYPAGGELLDCELGVQQQFANR
jgi:Prokaryotic lipoprotein-attachment site